MTYRFGQSKTFLLAVKWLAGRIPTGEENKWHNKLKSAALLALFCLVGEFSKLFHIFDYSFVSGLSLRNRLSLQ